MVSSELLKRTIDTVFIFACHGDSNYQASKSWSPSQFPTIFLIASKWRHGAGMRACMCVFGSTREVVVRPPGFEDRDPYSHGSCTKGMRQKILISAALRPICGLGWCWRSPRESP